MLTFLLVFHFIITLLLIGLVLVQKHDGGGLSAGLSSAANGFISSRGQANFLTKTTAILMTIFIVNCLVMAKIAKTAERHGSIIDSNTQELSAEHSDFDQTAKTIFQKKKETTKTQEQSAQKADTTSDNSSTKQTSAENASQPVAENKPAEPAAKK